MLAIESLSVAYGAKLALDQVSLEIAPGEILALVGPNGSGKTTLVRAVSGVVPANAGRVRHEGRDLLSMAAPERARRIAVVPQARQLGGAFSVEQTVLLGRTAHMGWLGRPQREDLAAARLAMDQTGVTELAGRRNAQLSGGEQQRVLLARALAQDTPILLLDEPTTHLDLRHQLGFLGLLKDLARRKRLAVLLALHDLNHVGAYADRVALLVEGRRQALGPPASVLTQDNLQQAFGVRVQVVSHPQGGAPVILPHLERPGPGQSSDA